MSNIEHMEPKIAGATLDRTTLYKSAAQFWLRLAHSL